MSAGKTISYKGMQLTTLAERRREVARLYAKERMPAEDIARLLNIHVSTVHRDLQRMRRQWQQEGLTDINSMLLRDLADLDAMEKECIDRLAGCKKAWQGARWMEERIKIKERRARLLGLDQPDKHLHLNANATLSKEERDQIVNSVMVSIDPLQIPMAKDTTAAEPEPDVVDAECTVEDCSDKLEADS